MQVVRAALYGRISLVKKADQDDDEELGQAKGVGRQLADVRELAERRGWEVVGEYRDDSISAFDGTARDGYQNLMADVAAGQVDRVVVYHTSRLWRSRRERAEAMDRLATAGVSVVAVKGPELDLTSAGGRMMADLLGAFDTGESEFKSERVTRAALERAQEERANGPVAYGFRREYVTDGAGQRMSSTDVEDPVEATIVREVVDRVLAGDVLRAIAADLNDREVPTPSRREGVQWRGSTFRKLATRPANIAERVYRGEVIGEAAWPAIVEPDKHAQVVALLTHPARAQRSDGARQHPAVGSSWPTA